MTRDLNTLEAEIEKYKSDDDLWKVVPGIANSAGNLCLHLCGNLQHFVGAVLGETGYRRNREEEFSLKNIAKAELKNEIEQTRKAIDDTLTKVTDDILSKPYPLDVLNEPVHTGFFLVHLVSHFNYHLGQINYHRRMLNKV